MNLLSHIPDSHFYRYSDIASYIAYVYKTLPDQAGPNEGECEEGVVQLAKLSHLPPPFPDSQHLAFPPQFDLLSDN